MDAAQAPGFAHQAGADCIWDTRTELSGGYAIGCLNNRLRARRLGRCKKAGFDHVPFDDAADRGDQRADIPALAPLAAPLIKHLFQLFRHEGELDAATEHRADRAGRREAPRRVAGHFFPHP